MKAIQLIGGGKEIQVFWSELLILEGVLDINAIEKIKEHYINKVEYRVKDMFAPLILNKLKNGFRNKGIRSFY